MPPQRPRAAGAGTMRRLTPLPLLWPQPPRAAAVAAAAALHRRSRLGPPQPEPCATAAATVATSRRHSHLKPPQPEHRAALGRGAGMVDGWGCAERHHA